MVDGKYIPPPPSSPLPPTPGENIYAELGEHGGLVDNTDYHRPQHTNNEEYLVPQDPHYNGLHGRSPSQSDYQRLHGEKPFRHPEGIDNPSYEHMDQNQNNVPMKRQPNETTPILDKDHKNRRNFESKQDYENAVSSQNVIPPPRHYMDMTGGAIVEDGYLQITH